MPVRVVEGVVQHYDWGDTEFIPKLLGLAGRGKPWAELWLGTHPNGPTLLDDGTPLAELTGELTYLLKVLSAAEPLSMQCHPNVEQALDGFERGVYPDANAKPELLVALTEFEALCGLRPADHVISELAGSQLASAVQDHGTAGAFEQIYRGTLDAEAIVFRFERSSDPRATLIDRLVEQGDVVSAAASLLLNHVVLQPGEAIHLTAGNVHAYLHGSGVELMGASDNVVRAGMTTKHVDVDELLRIFDREPLANPVMDVVDGRYPLPEAGVVLVRLDPGATHRSTGHELAIALDGTTLYLSPGTQIYADSETFVVTTD
ncbi:MAG: mannose-6-phosphate isomerase, class I [Ilumatobacter sp.]|uniref:mannose-6-phosphate isomerase, class I n=1 Tax=Ilumatobacter sp. TaxID=1967498 RepID=UPI003C716C88